MCINASEDLKQVAEVKKELTSAIKASSKDGVLPRMGLLIPGPFFFFFLIAFLLCSSKMTTKGCTWLSESSMPAVATKRSR